MLTLADIDRLENYLFSAKLDDVPNVFGRVLPLVFSELRVMAIALDKQAQEFLNHHEVLQAVQTGHHDPRAVGNPLSHEGRRNDVVGASPLPTPPAARHPQAVEVSTQVPSVAVGAQPGGNAGAESRSAGEVGASGVVGQVGGEVGRKRRGRPPKSRERTDPQLDALSIQPHPRLQAEGGA